MSYSSGARLLLYLADVDSWSNFTRWSTQSGPVLAITLRQCVCVCVCACLMKSLLKTTRLNFPSDYWANRYWLAGSTLPGRKSLKNTFRSWLSRKDVSTRNTTHVKRSACTSARTNNGAGTQYWFYKLECVQDKQEITKGRTLKRASFNI